MRGCANTSIALVLLICATVSSYSAFAGSYSAIVREAKLTRQDNDLLLSAEIEYRFSPRAIEALINGIPLHWEVDVSVKQKRDYWWDSAVAYRKLRFKMQYQALLNVYRVRNEDSGEGGSFSSLAAALGALSSIRYLPVFDAAILKSDAHYVAAVRVVFDRELLPLPLRTVAYLSPQWYLSSKWYRWPVKE